MPLDAPTLDVLRKQAIAMAMLWLTARDYDHEGGRAWFHVRASDLGLRDDVLPGKRIRVTIEAEPDGVPASVAPVAVAWEYRTWRDGKGGEPVGWGAWERLKPKGLQTMDDAVSEMRDYIMRGYRYELRWLAAHPDGVMVDHQQVTPEHPPMPGGKKW